MNRLPLLAAARPANVLARIPRPSPSLRFFTNTSSNVNGKDKQKFDRIGEEPLRPASSPLSTAALASSEDVAPLLKHGWALVTRAAELQRQQEKEAQSRETTIRVRDLRLAVGDEEGVDADDSRVVQALQLEKKYAFKTYTKCQDFFNAIAIRSNILKHHASITIDYGTVVIRWTTHDAGSSVTKRDVEMAEWCEEMAKALGTADDATTAKK